ncbi:hypothetical protein [Arthrobacter sp. YN]|uniref:hypothetical protein n=1 Tax=Arthrobacter sp. YN TaxID=2020486 RepID=UPI0012FE5B0C|nr:hypothetical protein [Arthrobacter sp. YN]
MRQAPGAGACLIRRVLLYERLSRWQLQRPNRRRSVAVRLLLQYRLCHPTCVVMRGNRVLI